MLSARIRCALLLPLMFHASCFGVCRGFLLQGTFDDNDHLYRPQAFADQSNLNTWRLWVDRVDDPLVTVAVLHRRIVTLNGKHTVNGRVDLRAVREDPDYLIFHEATCEFQHVDLAALEPNVKLALCINLCVVTPCRFASTCAPSPPCRFASTCAPFPFAFLPAAGGCSKEKGVRISHTADA